MRANNFLSLRNDQFPIVIKKTVQCLENIRRREVQLVEHYPVPLTQSTNEKALLKHQFAGDGVRDIGADVLLDVGVLVVVDANEAMTCPLREILNRTRLATRCRAFDENGEPFRGNDTGEINELGLDGGSHDVVFRRVFGERASLKVEWSKLDERRRVSRR